MKQILEYIINKSSKRYNIKADDNHIHQIVRDEIDRLGDEANLNHIDVSNCTNLQGLFNAEKNNYIVLNYSVICKGTIDKPLMGEYWLEGYGVFKKYNFDVSGWNVSNVMNMSNMFYECRMFDCNISDWDISNCKNFKYMFYKCKNFYQDLSSWKIEKYDKWGDSPANNMLQGSAIEMIKDFRPTIA